jgi:hypothetical protein
MREQHPPAEDAAERMLLDVLAHGTRAYSERRGNLFEREQL